MKQWMLLLPALFLLGVGLHRAVGGPSIESFQTHEVVPEKELLITDIKVVDSNEAAYPGAFSFGHLIEELAGDRPLDEFLLEWFALWEKDQEVNGYAIPARPAIRPLLLEPWQEKDGYRGEPNEKWHVNLANAPFRLLAIANRLDLGVGVRIEGREQISASDATLYYSAPEVRLVYGAVDRFGEPLEGGFTIIFEYGLQLPRRDAHSEEIDSLTYYAAAWHQLGDHADFDSSYLADLKRVTQPLTDRRCDPELELQQLLSSDTLTRLGLEGSAKVTLGRRFFSPGEIQAPALNQIRTNDGALGLLQEFRQCRIEDGKMIAVPVSGTPAAVFRDPGSKESRYLVKHLSKNARAIREGKHSLPIQIEGRSRRQMIVLAGGNATVPDNDVDFHWSLKRLLDRDVRRVFSMGTCTGCHTAETGTRFFHIPPRRAAEPSELSAFLAKDVLEVSDPSNPRDSHQFREMQDRAVILTVLLNPGIRSSAIRRLIRDRERRSH